MIGMLRPLRRLHRRTLLFALLLTLALGGTVCARHGALFPPFALERTWPHAERVFRHKLLVSIPGRAVLFSCDGLLRLGARAPVARVVCLGPLGMVLCDITVTPEGYSVAYMHPAFAAVPRAAENLALSVRSIWFAALPVDRRNMVDGIARETYGKTMLEHAGTDEGEQTVISPGPETAWRVTYTPAEPQPSRIVFTNIDKNYVVTIVFVAEQPEGGTTP